MRADSLQRMRLAGGEEPEIALAHILHVSATFRVQHRDAAVAVRHIGPFRRLMPMQLADAARTEPHVHAGYGSRDREIGLGHLTRPAAALDAFVGVVEGGPELRHVADVRGRRIDRIGELRLQLRILRPRIAEGARAAVDGALRRLVGITECRGMRRSGCQYRTAARGKSSLRSQAEVGRRRPQGERGIRSLRGSPRVKNASRSCDDVRAHARPARTSKYVVRGGMRA